ncbi:DVU3141 family protein [Rheinheimera soli]|uniref:Uncharacterized protein n=1 Tax=Rheinheimera soli TaxID=443616 RepID=A0ABU1VUA0_9GAMM|nr:DVU3141 family protein [Rheinheimera soli]MDR7119287.1 hypothetical protein [Rheinheimera soli]
MLVASCATTPFSSVPSNDSYQHKVSYLPANISNFLQKATAGQSFFLEQGSLGYNANVQVLDSYFSAAGRPCLSVLVEADLVTQPMIFCQYEPQRWGATRALVKAPGQ